MSTNYMFLPIQKKEYVPYEKTVAVHRAPTDDSIRLYEELVEKAQQSIIDSFKISNNVFSANITIGKNMSNFNTYVFYKMKMNGRDFKGKFDVDVVYGISRKDIVKEVVKLLSEKIAEDMLSENLSYEAHRALFGNNFYG